MGKTTIPNRKFVSAVAKDSGFLKRDVEKVFESIDNLAAEYLDQATEENRVDLALTRNISLINYYSKPTHKKDAFTGELYDVPGKYRIKARFRGPFKNQNLIR